MIVTIPSREQHEGIYAATVFINDYCPKCGGPRGVAYPAFSFDGSRRLSVTCWGNPCGHVDKYDKVRQEVRRRMRWQPYPRGDKYPFVPSAIYHLQPLTINQ